MKVFVRTASQSGFFGPFDSPELPDLIEKGVVSTDAEWLPALGQSYRQLKTAPDWRPMADLLSQEELTVRSIVTSPKASEGAVTAQTSASNGDGSATLCVWVGVILSVIGIYFLLVSPSADDASGLSTSVVNLQRLYIGQTSAIAGAIFLAAGLRPRAR